MERFSSFFTRKYKIRFPKLTSIFDVSDALFYLLNIDQQKDVRSGIKLTGKEWVSKFSLNPVVFLKQPS